MGFVVAASNPILIVEVLSDGTERVDLKEKFDNYTSIPSLLEYVVVSQDVPLVRLRNANILTFDLILIMTR
ncbi:Uma2 family endonuclease [Thiothrix subterranea]|uniref:Uma2 family endonuclease n=1 Tax=Thiothrix subterranea TaxID=2735563 RepID=A0ABU0Y410_9GAMM|nr:Uma2 family endonuclease [Thiothrix subterranea]MDQ5767532.1 Uma2 family endonuclease [Thiothrix subterranea]